MKQNKKNQYYVQKKDTLPNLFLTDITMQKKHPCGLLTEILKRKKKRDVDDC